MHRQTSHPGQIGRYWLSRKPRKDRADENWCRTWYDERARQTRRVSLGTSDFQTASIRLAEWVVVHERESKASPSSVMIETVLLRYWDDHAQHLPSSKTQRLCLSYWQEFWTGLSVADVTPMEQARFRNWMAARGTGASGIDRILSVGRAALNRAKKWQELRDVPHIFGTMSADAKRQREPKGRPITIAELAQLIDAAESRHVLVYVLIAATTLARPAAILDLRPSQYDKQHGLLNLNPPGRAQNKKHRPIVPVAPTLKPWLERAVGPSDRYVSHRGEPVGSILHAWRLTRAKAGLDERVTPYSIRHGMARELRKLRVPTEQISLFLGHLPSGSAATTSIYAPYEPDFLSEAVQAIESVMAEVCVLLKRPLTTVPASGDRIRHARSERHPRSIPAAKETFVRQLILSGAPHAEVVRRSGVSSGTVSKVRQLIKANVRLFRNPGEAICVPIACPVPDTSHEPHLEIIEKIGGPGRTRTCDNTVMSGAF
jgi:integrase